jgi:hypothetical protein
MMMGIIIPAFDYNACAKILKPVTKYIDKIEVSQFNAHSAFLYNYPEKAKNTVVLVGIQSNFVDISLVKNGKPVYYNLARLDSPDQIGELCENEFNKLTEEYVDVIHNSMFFGSALTKDMLIQTWEISMMLGIESEKLNAFRMTTTQLDERRREYCSRVSHIFAPCVGACVPAYHERYKLIK